MDEFLRNLSSPSWWIGVVVVSVALNILSGYLKDGLDRILPRASNWWAQRSEKQRNLRAAKLELLQGDKNEQLLAKLEVVETKINVLMALALSTVFWLLGVINRDSVFSAIGFAFGTLLLLISVSALNRSIALGDLLSQARYKRETGRVKNTGNDSV